ncbi:carbohydrate ABC transporter permease [Haloarchaeobius sp. HRN-SO-5]|uniref:carbohydrate ABC transporter permease n=1 Tax=Haloarchaeobius sp. HRN-SO-5 TaxID=3446118 RepID=UPI003EBA7333
MTAEESTATTTADTGFAGIYEYVPPETLQTFRRLVVGVLIGAVCLFYLFPIYWMVVSSFKGLGAYSLPAQYVPQTFSFEAYRDVLFKSKFPTFYWNSVIVAVSTVVVTDVSAVLAGYGLARLEFPWKKTFAKSILFGYMFPPLLLGIPIYMIWDKLNMVNTLYGLVLAQLAIILPFCVWIMWKFFLSIDESYEEAAWLCGASRPRAFFQVALPHAKPGLIAISIWAFAMSWNDFSLALLLLTKLNVQTLPIGILAFVEQNTILWGQMMAAITLVSLPPFVVVLTLQKYVLEGFSIGGMH